MPATFSHVPGLLPADRASAETSFYAACKLYQLWYSANNPSSRLRYGSQIEEWLTVFRTRGYAPSMLRDELLKPSPAARMAIALHLTNGGSEEECPKTVAYLGRLITDGLRDRNFGLVAASVHGGIRLDNREMIAESHKLLLTRIDSLPKENLFRANLQLIADYLTRNYPRKLAAL